MRRLALGCLAVLFVAGPARADDPRRDLPSIIPWTDANLAFLPEARKLTLQFGALLGERVPLLLHVSAGAPLDQDTRLAGIVDGGRRVSGFAGTASLGYDGRAARRVELRREVEELARLVEGLGDLGAVDLRGREQLCRRHEVADRCTNASLIEAVCKRNDLACASPDEAFAALRGHLCQRYLGGCPGGFRRRAEAFSRRRCGRAEISQNADGCIEVGWYLDMAHREEVAAEAAQSATRLGRQADELLEVLRRSSSGSQELDPESRRTGAELAKEIDEELKGGLWRGFPCPSCQAIAARLPSVREILRRELDETLQRHGLALRDLEMVGAESSSKRLYFAAVLDFAASYDRLSAYQNDLAKPSVEVEKYDLQLGANGSLYVPAGVTLNLRLGWERSLRPGASQVERCVSRTSTAPTVTGRSCDGEALFFTGELPKPEDQLYLRLALGYQLLGALKQSKFVPGIELRAAVEGIGAKKTADFRLGAFFTPISGRLGARLSLGLSFWYAIDEDAAGSTRQGSWAVVPYASLGATASTLLTRLP